MQELERRFIAQQLAPVAVDERADAPKKIVGYAARFYDPKDEGTEFVLAPGVKERIAPAAFRQSLEEDDVLGLFNHNMDFPLARRGAGTLLLKADERGMYYEIDPPDTQLGRDTMTSIKRGDIGGSSFGYFIRKAKWSREGDWDIRMIEDAKLVDVGPVTSPAYKAASAGLRFEDCDALKREHEQWLNERAEALAAENREVAERNLGRWRLAKARLSLRVG